MDTVDAHDIPKKRTWNHKMDASILSLVDSIIYSILSMQALHVMQYDATKTSKHHNEFQVWKVWNTLPETNIAPENGWLEYYFPFGMAYFQVLC